MEWNERRNEMKGELIHLFRGILESLIESTME